MFEKEALDSIVHRELIKVPENHSIAVITVINSDGVKLVTAVRKNGWEIEAYVEHKLDKTHDFEYGAVIQWSK